MEVQRTIDQHAVSTKPDPKVETAKMVVNSYLSFSIVANKEFKNFFRKYAPSITLPSPNTLISTTKRIADVIHQFVVEELKGKRVCIILDGMTKNKTTFYNVLLSTDSTNQWKRPAIFFWDCVAVASQTGEAIGGLIASVHDELKSNEITANAYASDNCATMVKAGVCASQILGKTIMRIPCGSHILNLALLDIMKENCIGVIWKNVYATIPHY